MSLIDVDSAWGPGKVRVNSLPKIGAKREGVRRTDHEPLGAGLRPIHALIQSMIVR